MAGQLRVDDLIAPLSEGARLLDAQQKVRQPKPPVLEESGLVDDVVAAPDRLRRGLGRGPQSIQPRRGGGVVVACIDACDAPPSALEPRQISGLVFESTPGDEIDLRIEPDRPVYQPGHGRQLQAYEMLAGQEADQIGRGEDGCAADELHRRSR